MPTIRAALAALLLAAAPTQAPAGCSKLAFEDVGYSVCSVDPETEELRLFRLDSNGRVLGTFQRLNTLLARSGQQLGFAMNAGMYHEDRSPVGLYIENGIQQHRIITSAGPGNFGMLPNGILCIRDRSARVIETGRYVENGIQCRDATQSGPMLVIDGKLHPRFLADSTSRRIRNGVGVDRAGIVWFVISDSSVTFHEFGRLFRDRLRTPNALFLDGRVSRLFAPELGRSDGGLPMGPIVGTVTKLGR